MGNHAAGRAMGAGAKAVLASLPKKYKLGKKEAMALLDTLCEPWRGCDAEFEGEDGDDFIDHRDPMAPLGQLIAAAFAPKRDWVGELERAEALGDVMDADTNPTWLAWQESKSGKGSPLEKFRARYDLY